MVQLQLHRPLPIREWVDHPACVCLGVQSVLLYHFMLTLRLHIPMTHRIPLGTPDHTRLWNFKGSFRSNGVDSRYLSHVTSLLGTVLCAASNAACVSVARLYDYTYMFRK